VNNIKSKILNIIDLETEALICLKEQLDFSKIYDCINIINNTKGKVLITGIGTSRSVAKRWAHLFSCIGIPSFYVHPSDQQHGASGLLDEEDLVIALSKGGESEEVNRYLEIANKLNCHIISITGRKNTTMSKLVDISLLYDIPDNYELLRILPTSSTLGVCLIGDIFLNLLIEEKGFDKDKFELLHPGGWTHHKLETQN